MLSDEGLCELLRTGMLEQHEVDAARGSGGDFARAAEERAAEAAAAASLFNDHGTGCSLASAIASG